MKNKKANGVLVFIFVVIFIILLVYFSMFITAKATEREEDYKCKLLNRNGYETKIDKEVLFIHKISHCFVKVDNEKYVPYDKFIRME